ncbi:MAG TPA: protease pro-enzyme activation domain-containing protein, partial [Streptosporangiaceae bacterium]|nr:protease pro-enzyme activation domain-containing protein [Streptosporangiaceae bacterium]
MGVISRPVRAGAVAVMGLAITAFTGTLASAGAATAAPSASQGFVALANSVPPTTDTITGRYTSSTMQVEVAVAPRDEAGLNRMLAALYDKNSPSYHRWLSTGQFDARYAPAAATQAAVAKFLGSSGLTVLPSGSPFLVRATGSSATVQSTFHTTLNTFKDPRGLSYFANSTPVYLPASLAGAALGVVGLTNTVRNAQHVQHVLHFNNTMRRAAQASSATSCETPYPTKQQLFGYYVGGVNFPSGYGAGPGCSGLTPSQDNSLYGAPNVGPRGKGKGVDIAVFELSAYLHSDAPNDFTGQTELDEWTAIAKANVADSVSSSWALCEKDAGAAYAQAEN